MITRQYADTQKQNKDTLPQTDRQTDKQTDF